MTIETWMTEAGLPITEKPATELEAAKLSLRKWEALRNEVQDRHGVSWAATEDYCYAEQCGLCHFHASVGDRWGLDDIDCSGCVLARGGKKCGDAGSVWQAAFDDGDATVMIAALEHAVKTLEEEQ